jgi:BA14K-like protein
VILGAANMIALGKTMTAASLLMLAALAALLDATGARAQDLGVRPLRYGNTSGWSYDNRDDDRDVPTNGFFPGNFTADPSTAWLGAVGVLAGNSYRSPLPYPSQVVIGPSPYQNGCAQRYRSYDPTSGTYLGRDGLRHRC